MDRSPGGKNPTPESSRSFAARHGLTHDQVLTLCWKRLIRGARFNSFTNSWQIYYPAKILKP